MSVRVLAPGALTTLQDRGRCGGRALGVGRAGALDAYSSAIANLLVGNPSGAALLEITLHGPKLQFTRATRIALCGGVFDAHVDGAALPGWRPVTVPAGAVLAIGGCRKGARAWLAVAGGFVAPPVMGSVSTDLRGGFGGIDGRALRAGDMIEVGVRNTARDEERGGDRDGNGDVDGLAIAPWWIDPTPDLDFAQPAIVRVISGADATRPADALFLHPWCVAAASDRQGLRLQPVVPKGIAPDAPLQPADARERISEPVAPGTIQLPPDGQPIILLADAQTHGGYPRIGHAIQADWPRLAQLRPGDRVQLQPCTPAQAWQARRSQAQRLAKIALAIRQRDAIDSARRPAARPSFGGGFTAASPDAGAAVIAPTQPSA